jgi:uncharacterized protein (DUF305 family)
MVSVLRNIGGPGAARVILGLIVAVGTGAPATSAGQDSPLVDRPEALRGLGRDAPNPADVRFMSGMIIHHAQAVLMSAWAPTHDAGPGVVDLCRKIHVSQRDEIALMERWLRQHGQPIPDTAWVFDYEGPGMARAHLMAGMLTVDQLRELDAARGREFDRLFLTYMIQHHAGALTMVERLMGSPGGGQDNFVFQFASEINAGQTVEIELMRRMLAAQPSPTSRS